MIFINKKIKSSNRSYYLNQASIKPAFYDNSFFIKVQYFFDVYGLTFLKLVLLCSDIYTCIKLLAFNQWSNSYIKPYISFKISKWLYSSCILVSITIILFRLIQSFRLMKETDNIIIIYIDFISRQYYNFKSYSNYCIFKKITPVGFLEKLTFHCYFQLNNNYTLVFGDTPRQVINGLTLYSVLISNGELNQKTNLSSIVARLKYIAENKNYDEAVILSMMLFSFVLWLCFFASFFVALLAYPYVYLKIHSKNCRNLQEYVVSTIYKNLNAIMEKSGFTFESTKKINKLEKDYDYLFEYNNRIGNFDKKGTKEIMDLENLNDYEHYYSVNSDFKNNNYSYYQRNISVMSDIQQPQQHYPHQTVTTPSNVYNNYNF